MLLSLVIPIYNEEEGIPALLEALRRVLGTLDCEQEVLFVDDGSKDATAQMLDEAAAADPRFKVLHFTRNFGHQAAITAGLDHASGDAVVTMDADLQDPPELIPEMLTLYRQGYDVVSAQRVEREGEGLFKRGTAALFYGLMRKAVDPRLQSQVGDFRLFSRAAVTAVRGFREQHRFLRGLVAWLGLKEAILPFERHARVAGTTKYPFWKMVRFAWTAISSFSALPLRLSLAFGLAITGLGLIYAAWALYAAFILHATVRGWTSLVAMLAVFAGAILTAIGLIGEYVARIYDEIKVRPLYVLGETRNLPPGTKSPVRAVVLPVRAMDAADSGREAARR